MIVHLAFTGCVFGLTVVNYYVGRRNVMYPPFLFSCIWLLVLCLYMVPIVEVGELGAYTLTVVVSGIIAFSVGGAILRGRRHPRPAAASPPGNPVPKKLILFCCLAILPGFFLELQRLSGVGGFDSLLTGARAALVEAIKNGEEAFSSPVYSFAPTLATYCAFLFLIEGRDGRKERAWVWGSLLTAIAFSILTTGRTVLMELLVGCAGIYLLKNKKLSATEAWKIARWPLVACLALFLVVTTLDKASSGGEIATTDLLAESAFGYIVGPVAGFGYVLHHPSEYKYDPNHTFKRFLPLISPIAGFQYTPAPRFDDFVYLPYPTNVYTVFKFYYVDFGLVGMLVTMFLIGAGQTWLYQKALPGAHFYMFLYAVSLYPLALSTFDDLYSGFLGYLGAVVFAAAYFRVSRALPLKAPVRSGLA